MICILQIFRPYLIAIMQIGLPTVCTLLAITVRNSESWDIRFCIFRGYYFKYFRESREVRYLMDSLISTSDKIAYSMSSYIDEQSKCCVRPVGQMAGWLRQKRLGRLASSFIQCRSSASSCPSSSLPVG